MAEKKLAFEAALARLEQIVTEIEEGQVPLESSIEKYAQGIELIKQCRAILDQAEKKVQLLAEAEGKGLQEAGALEESDQ